ncbi:hypothetical protein E4H12_12365 [Candidatus Thorarchaeota archaeon]|nr:MAG: hypothetical protein E4H12_12365 [Candidatus Thorarchaeota archaeon]
MLSKSKKGKTVSKKPVALIALIVVLIGSNIGTVYYFMFYRPSVPLEDVPMAIQDVTSNPAAFIGKVITITGYYVISANYSMLVESLMSFMNNSLQPSNYILVTGAPPPSMEQYLGLQCDVKGTGEWADQSDGVLGVRYSGHVGRQSEATFPGIYKDAVRDMDYLIEHIQLPVDLDAEKYAILYSGGIKPEKAYYRYWNDIIYMHFLLQMKGYSSDNIYVVYKDGVGEDPYTPVDYPATHASLDTVFAQLSVEMGARDTLFFYTTNHGGNGGISVWDPMDSSGALTHAQVSDWLDSITCDHMIIVMEQCVSGKFIQYISAANRVILTACSDGESSFGCDTEGQWDEFVYHFMSALYGFKLPGGLGDADADYYSDGQISMREAFIYAAVHDSREETPLYCDNDTGVGLSVGPVVFGTGFLGDTIFL